MTSQLLRSSLTTIMVIDSILVILPLLFKTTLLVQSLLIHRVICYTFLTHVLICLKWSNFFNIRHNAFCCLFEVVVQNLHFLQCNFSANWRITNTWSSIPLPCQNPACSSTKVHSTQCFRQCSQFWQRPFLVHSVDLCLNIIAIIHLVILLMWRHNNCLSPVLEYMFLF